MPNGDSQTNFTFPELSNGARLVWSISGRLTIDRGSTARGWDGNPANLDMGNSRELPAAWPGRNNLVEHFWVYPRSTGASPIYDARLGFLSATELETQRILEEITHYWLVWRIQIGTQLRAFQYRFGTARYGFTVQDRYDNAGLVFSSFAGVGVQQPSFVWSGVDPRMYSAPHTPGQADNTFALGIYAAEPQIEPLLVQGAPHELQLGTVAVPDLMFVNAEALDQATSLSARAPGSLRMDDEAGAWSDFATGLRGTGEDIIELPASLLRGIRDIKLHHERRVDNVDSTDSSFRTRYVHAGHRTHIDIVLRFRSEADFEAFGGIVAPLGEAATVRLALSEVPRLIPQGMSSTPLVLSDLALAGATELHIEGERELVGGPVGNGITAAEAPGITFEHNGTTYTISSASGGRVFFTPATTAAIPAGTVLESSIGQLRAFTNVSRGRTNGELYHYTNPPTFPSAVRNGQTIQPSAGRKLHSIVATRSEGGEHIVTITPPLVSQMPRGARMNTGENVLYYMQPQGELGWRKSNEAPGVVTATYRFREVV